jgi:beta-lactamase regulating signal transducer with metallopeptidase domain
MAHIETLTIDPAVVSALGQTLIHFVWQGLAIAILLRLTLPLMHGAVARYNAAAAAMGLMALAPLATFWKIYANASQQESAPSSLQKAGAFTIETFNLAFTAVRGSGSVVVPSTAYHWTSADAAPLCVALWLAGVAVLSLRSLGGWLILRRLRRQCELLPDEIRRLCDVLRRGLEITRPIGFFGARGVDAPAVIGWFKPIVLLPLSALAGLDPVQLEAVIAHELAHIKRHDALVNLFQIAMETIFFYHPAVWWTSRLIRQERELCCDDVAVAVSGEVLPYAKALALMEEWRHMPDFAMAINSQPLKSRIARLLGGSSQAATRFPAPTMLLMLILATTSAALLAKPLLSGTLSQTLSETVNVIQGHYQEQSAQEQPAPSEQPRAARTLDQQTPVAQPAPMPVEDPAGVETPKPSPLPEPAAVAAPETMPRPAPMPAPKALGVAGSSAGSAIAFAPAPAVGFAQSEDQATTGAKHGSFIAEMEAAGYKDLTADQLVSLKIQGVTGDYVRQMRSIGLSPSVNQIIGMKIQGVTPEYIHEMQAAGFKTDINDIIGMKIQGVTPEYLKEVRATGLNPTAHELMGMKIQGVTPQYVQEVRAAGWPNATVHDVIGMKIQGVKPTDAAEFRKLGFQDISLHDLIGLKIQDVSPEYITAMRAAGLKSDSLHDYMGAKIQGVTPEFAEKARQHGFKDLTLHKLIALKMADVL